MRAVLRPTGRGSGRPRVRRTGRPSNWPRAPIPSSGADSKDVMSSILLMCLVSSVINAPAPTLSPIRVNEVASGTSGFVELRNTGNAPADIGGWVIRTCISGKTAPLATIPLGVELPAGGFFLVAGHEFSGTAERLIVVGSIDPGEVSLRNDTGALVDSVGFTKNSPCREGEPSEQCAYSSLGRDVQSRDTNDNYTDFTCQLTTPDQANEMAPFKERHGTET